MEEVKNRILKGLATDSDIELHNTTMNSIPLYILDINY